MVKGGPPHIFRSPAKRTAEELAKQNKKTNKKERIPQIKIFHFSPHSASPFSRKRTSLPISDTPFQETRTWAVPGNPALGCPQAGDPFQALFSFCINSQSSLSPFERNLKSSLGGQAWLGLMLRPLPLNRLSSGTGLHPGLSTSNQAGERQSSPPLASCSHQCLLPPSSTFLR